MAGQRKLHIVPHQMRWAVKEEGDEEPMILTDMKEQAINNAREIVHESGMKTRIIVHTLSGSIETEWTEHPALTAK